MRLVRKYHKWLMAVVGLQFLIWSITGLYMVSMDIHYIHGESLVKQPSKNLALDQVSFPITELLADYPDAEGISLTHLMDRQVYRFKRSDRSKHIIDAKTGAILSDIDKSMAKQIALYHYSGGEGIRSIRLLDDSNQVPSELYIGHLPVWQVRFNHFSEPTLYISRRTGEVVTKRHDYWRLFDWMWRFHIMDYDDGENSSNSFLLVIALVGLLSALAGTGLIYQWLKRSRREGAHG